jgi:putative transport protein
MFEWFYNLFSPTEHPDITQSIVTIMLVIGGGVLFGRIRIAKISLGVVAVMFTGLLLGHYGYRIQIDILHFIRDLGLIFFVYAVGIQVGPSFFSSFKKEGIMLNAISVGTILMSGVVTYIIFKNTDLGIENSVGIMSGSITNTTGLGAAKGALQEIHAQFPDKKFVDPAIAYAITYPLGVFGLIFSIVVLKNIFKIDTENEMRKFRMMRIKSEEPLLAKKCRVTNPNFIHKTIHHAVKEIGKEVVITRIKHSKVDAVFSPSLDTRLEQNDVLMVFGTESNVDAFIKMLGRESADLFIETTSEIITKNLFVTNANSIQKSLSELDLYNKYELKVTRVFRSGNEILARPSLVLFFGDKLHVVGTQEAIDEVEKIIGNKEKKLIEPDFLSLFGGLLFGVLLGSIPIFIPSMPVPVKLGFAAGPLIAALLISRYGGIWVIHSYFNNGAIMFMKDLGLTLFFVSVGIHAGESFYVNFFKYNGWMMMFYGLFILMIPLILMVIVSKIFFKMNFLQLVGMISGTHTDSAALAFGTTYLDSDIPIQSYAQVYPLAVIARIFVAQILILLLAT